MFLCWGGGDLKGVWDDRQGEPCMSRFIGVVHGCCVEGGVEGVDVILGLWM